MVGPLKPKQRAAHLHFYYQFCVRTEIVEKKKTFSLTFICPPFNFSAAGFLNSFERDSLNDDKIVKLSLIAGEQRQLCMIYEYNRR